MSAESVIAALYHTKVTKVATIKETKIFRSNDNCSYLVTFGTYLKWETALRKALECVQASSKVKEASSVHLCLVLAVCNGEMSFGDQKQIEGALEYIGVKVFFVK